MTADLHIIRRIDAIEDALEPFRKADTGTPSGTSFPTGIASGFVFFRTDLGMLCYYDGSRWLTVEVFGLTLAPFGLNPLPFAGAGPATLVLASVRSDYQIWFVYFAYYIFVNTTNNATNYWAITMTDTSGASLWTPNTSAAGVGQSSGETAAGVAGANGATYINAQLTKVNAPGTVGAFHLTAYYRLIVT